MADLFGVGGQALLDRVVLPPAFRARVNSARHLFETLDFEIELFTNLAGSRLRGHGGGVSAAVKIRALVAGMVVGADSINDMDLLRHGGMPAVHRRPGALHVGHVFAPVHLRPRPPARRRRRWFPGPVSSGDSDLVRCRAVVLVDLDDTIRATYGYAKQGAGRDYTGVEGLNALLVTICTPLRPR